VDLALTRFTKCEMSKVIVELDGDFGDGGCAKYDLSPGSKLEYEVTLLDFLNVNLSSILCLRIFYFL
jgi:hypothetical protein